MILVWVFPRGPWEFPTYGFPGYIRHSVPFDLERSSGSDFRTAPLEFFSSEVSSSEEGEAIKEDRSNEVFVSIRVPSGGRETKEGPLTSGSLSWRTSEDVRPCPDGSQVPSVHHEMIPERIFP